MISRHTSSVPEDVVPRLLYRDSTCSQDCGRCSQACPRCSQAWAQHSQTCHWRSQVLPGVSDGHCIGPVNSRIWPPWDSGPTILRHSQSLLVNNIHFADVGGQSGGGSLGGRQDRSWDSIHWFTHNCGNVQNWVQYGLPRDKGLDGSGRQSIMGWCSTQCMLYSVITLGHGMER